MRSSAARHANIDGQLPIHLLAVRQAKVDSETTRMNDEGGSETALLQLRRRERMLRFGALPSATAADAALAHGRLASPRVRPAISKRLSRHKQGGRDGGRERQRREEEKEREREEEEGGREGGRDFRPSPLNHLNKVDQSSDF